MNLRIFLRSFSLPFFMIVYAYNVNAQAIVFPINGNCGSANASVSSIAPTTGLCSVGSPSSVVGNGKPWQWSCSGINNNNTAACWATVQAYYVSPIGNDSNAGTSPSLPFATLTKAQTAMEGSSIKTTYLMGGTYTITSSLALGSSDAGEAWVGYPGQTPVLDGGNTVTEAIYWTGINNITIRWITFQNFIGCGSPLGSVNGGVVDGRGGSGNVIDSNIFLNIGSTNSAGNINQSCPSSAISGGYGFQNSMISHNLFVNIYGYAIFSGANQDNPPNSNTSISFNSTSNTCIGLTDCGGIYVNDREKTSVGQFINNNIVYNFGLSSWTDSNKGIYLDDWSQNVTVQNNIVYGAGNYGIQYHGGIGNTVQNNIFDLTQIQYLALYQDMASEGYPGGGMAGNNFKANIVYSTSSTVPLLWNYVGTGTVPAVANNIYYDQGNSIPNTGTIVDANPLYVNPLFTGQYQLPYNSPALGIGFVSTMANQVGPLPH